MSLFNNWRRNDSSFFSVWKAFCYAKIFVQYVELALKCQNVIIPSFLYVFMTTPALPEVPEARFNVRRTYSLSSLAFERVTRGSAITNTFPLPPVTIHEGATGHLEQTNNCLSLCPNHSKAHTPAPVTGDPQQGCQPHAGGQFNDLSRSTYPLFLKIRKFPVD